MIQEFLTISLDFTQSTTARMMWEVGNLTTEKGVAYVNIHVQFLKGPLV